MRFAPPPAVAPAAYPGRAFGALIADRACATDVLRADLAARGQAAVPPQANRTGAVECGREMYQWHRLVESFFCLLQRLRRIATRCGKTGASYRGMIHGVAGPAWRSRDCPQA